MKNLSFIYCCLFTTFFFYGCRKVVENVYRIKLQNNSTVTIKFYENYNYPDSSIAIAKPPLRIIPPTKFGFIDSKRKFEDVLPYDIITMFVFSKDTLDNYSWDVIRDEKKVLKRYDSHLKDIERDGWIISYP